MKYNILKASLLITTVSCMSLFAFAQQEKVIKIFRNGSVVAEYKANEIDYIQIDDLKTDNNEPGNEEIVTVNGVSFKMIKVEGGTYMMGSDDGYNDEKPVHGETIDTFYIGETEVTQALWTAVMGTNPSNCKGDDLPVEYVSWDECQAFIGKLNDLTGKNFRLPYEAEWEYAARGGNQSLGYTYSGSNDIESVAWYTNNSESKTHPVVQKQPNELGIYDMSGNVWEWCEDYYCGSYSQPRNSFSLVIRGGGWDYTATDCRVTTRNRKTSDFRFTYLGLRLAF